MGETRIKTIPVTTYTLERLQQRPRPRCSHRTRGCRSRCARVEAVTCAVAVLPCTEQHSSGRSEPSVTSSDEWSLICLCPFSLNAMFDQRDASIPTGLFCWSHLLTKHCFGLCSHLSSRAQTCSHTCSYWCIGVMKGCGSELTPQFGFRTHLCVDVCVNLSMFYVHCVLITVCCILK